MELYISSNKPRLKNGSDEFNDGSVGRVATHGEEIRFTREDGTYGGLVLCKDNEDGYEDLGILDKIKNSANGITESLASSKDKVSDRIDHIEEKFQETAHNINQSVVNLKSDLVEKVEQTKVVCTDEFNDARRRLNVTIPEPPDDYSFLQRMNWYYDHGFALIDFSFIMDPAFILSNTHEIRPFNHTNFPHVDLLVEPRPRAVDDRGRNLDEFLLEAHKLKSIPYNEEFRFFDFGYVTEKFQKCVHSMINHRSWDDLKLFLETLSEDFEPVTVKISFDNYYLVDLDEENRPNTDLRSDMHSVGRVLHGDPKHIILKVETLHMRRKWKPLMYANMMSMGYDLLKNQSQINIMNLLEQKIDSHTIVISQQLFHHCLSVRNSCFDSNLERAKINIALAIKNNSTVNIPYFLLYARSSIYEDTARYCLAIREYYQWKNVGNGTNFL
jgi:hypothetical protein